jgi:hypothetical protein
MVLLLLLQLPKHQQVMVVQKRVRLLLRLLAQLQRQQGMLAWGALQVAIQG